MLRAYVSGEEKLPRRELSFDRVIAVEAYAVLLKRASEIAERTNGKPSAAYEARTDSERGAHGKYEA